MRRISFFLSIILTFFTTAFASAFAEGCAHSWEYTNNGESGHTTFCSLCRETHTDAHILTHEYKDATCLSPAVTSYHCALCGYTYSFTEGEKNPGHAWGEYTVVREATCREAGIQKRVCPDCGHTESAEIPQLEHSYGEWKPHDEQWHIHYCRVCDWAYKGSHRLNDGEVISEPTDRQLGLIEYTCRVCGAAFQNILRADGSIFALETKDVLGNNTNYLLAASRDEESVQSSEIVLSDASRIDLRPEDDNAFSVYASSKTGNYAGILAESGEISIDIIPKTDFETAQLEFIKLLKDARANLRIFNASGAIEIQNLNGPRVIIAQHKNADGSIITLLMRLTEKRDSMECEAEIHQSDGGVISIANNNGEYAFTLPENSKKIAALTFKYQRKTGKITVNARNADNNANGITIYILEGIEFMRTAQNTKTAETFVQLTDEAGAWRLRATFPSGYTMETPLFYKDGSYAHPTNQYLMDEKALGTLMLIDPMPEAETETQELQIPELPTVTPMPAPSPTPTQTPEPEKIVFQSVPASQATVLTDETASFSKGDELAFTVSNCPGIVIQYSSMQFYISQADEAAKTNISAIKLVEQGASFKIQNAYTLPTQFMLGSGTTSVTIKAEIKNANGITQEISLGTYTILP